MDGARAIGFLIAGTVNNALRWDDETPGCCNVCCGPCKALKWLQDNQPDAVDHWLQALWGTGIYDWQRPDGGMDWSVMQEVWRVGKERGCASVNGVAIPCHELRGEDGHM